MSGQKPITHFGLRDITRYTTTVDSNGKGVFSKADQGDFEATMGDGRVARFDLFQAGQVPLNINDGADIKWSAENQVCNLSLYAAATATTNTLDSQVSTYPTVWLSA
jgi:hypothetical protein